MIDLDALWRVVATKATEPGAVRTHGSGHSTAAGEILVAVDDLGGRMLLFPTAHPDRFAPDTSTRVHLTRRTLEWAGGVGDFVAVTCSLDRLQPVFTVLAEDMVRAAIDADEPGSVLRRELDEWRDLLTAERRQLLSTSQLVGLTAELITLRDELRQDPRRDVTVWTGPDRTTHDLRRAARALEVKGSLVREGLFIGINGARQLEPPQGGSLHLVFYRFEEVPDGDVAAPEVVQEILELGVNRHEFLDRLAAADYDLAETEQYLKRRLQLIERRIYVVDENFPRIIPGSFAGDSLPVGVMRLRYTVDLSGASPAPLSPAEGDAVLSDFGRAM